MVESEQLCSGQKWVYMLVMYKCNKVSQKCLFVVVVESDYKWVMMLVMYKC